MGKCLSSNKNHANLAKQSSIRSKNSLQSLTKTDTISESRGPKGEMDAHKLTKQDKMKLASELRPKKDLLNIFDLMYGKENAKPLVSSRNSMNVGTLVCELVARGWGLSTKTS